MQAYRFTAAQSIRDPIRDPMVQNIAYSFSGCHIIPSFRFYYTNSFRKSKYIR